MLRASVPIVTELLSRHIEQGEALGQQAAFIGEIGEHERWRAARHQWIELTLRTFGHIYDGTEEADTFARTASSPPDGQPWQAECKRDAAHVKEAVELMISFRDRLDLEERGGEGAPAKEQPAHAELERSVGDSAAQEPAQESPPEPAKGPRRRAQDGTPGVGAELEPSSGAHAALEQSPAAPAERSREPAAPSPSGSAVNELLSDGSGRVFLVHGRDDRWKQAVAGLLELAGPHEVTILNDRPGDGTALVEHFTQHPPGSRYAVILLTADDIGAPRLESDGEPFYSPRADQGVIFAMGLLVAALTPRCICVLYEEGVELPCDMAGIAYLRLDQSGGWRSKLLLQLRGAGLDYDLNALAANTG